jgi:predicted nucleic acid-binding protein
MKRCTVIIPDAGPFNSLWVADRLDLLLALDMRLVVVDAVYDELTSDLTYAKDRDVKTFIDINQPPFVVEPTEYGQFVRTRKRAGERVKPGAGETAWSEFMRASDGLRKYLTPQEPVLLLYEDRDVRVINRPPFLHLLSTVGMLRGLERVGVLPSADDVIYEMTHPSKPDRRPSDARVFTDLPEGHDEPAVIGSSWSP